MALIAGGIWVLVFSSAIRAAEMKMPEQEFRMPVDLPMDLSGNFGQLRSTHFHAGLDIRTRQVIGHKIVAVADGYVSRIGVNVYGYGKVVYVTHPNGKTTVYAHLDQFGPKLAKRVEEAWVTQKKYEVNIELKPWELPVVKGEQLGLSGNTGGSGGPHLHFEVRDTETGDHLNPLKHGYKLADTKKPVFTGLRLYSLEESGRVNGQKSQVDIPILPADGNYRSKLSNIPVSGRVGIGINAYDPLDLNSFKMGLYALKMTVNGEVEYAYVHDRFSYEEGRRIVLHCDYEDKISSNNAIEKLWVLPGNDSRLYARGPGSGVLQIEPGKTYSVRIEAQDINGNISRLEFTLSGEAKQKEISSILPAGRDFSFLSDSAEEFSGDAFSVIIPKDGLYDHLFLPALSKSILNPGELAAWQIGHTKMFLKKQAEIRLKLPAIPEPILKKLYLLHEGKREILGELKNTEYVFSYSRLGRFALLADTLKPDLNALEITPEGTLKNYRGTLRFKTADTHSGIASWEAYINDSFQLLEYEYKENLLFTRNPNVKPGKNTIRVVVKDAVGNAAEFKAEFSL